MNSVDITFCSANLDFTATRMRTSGMQSTVALPALDLSVFFLVITDLLTRAHSTREVSLRDASQEALLLFPTLVLGPHRLGASSSSVRTEVAARMDF
jgi:hypothetical protein